MGAGMSRVLLMVDLGDGKVRCVSRTVGFDPAEILQGEEWLGDSGFYVWWTAHREATIADRWWLVEAETADDGRTVILQERVLPPLGLKSTLGRILAQGGRDA